MQVRAEQITEQLRLGLKPVYLISGDEPLQVMEVADAVREAAKQQGFSEREILNVDAQFDWSVLLAASEALSLFSQQKLLDLRLNSCKIGAAGSKAIQHYLAHPPTDKVLLIQCGRLDKACRSAAWVKAIEQQGVLVQVWDLSPQQALAWLAKRMRETGLNANEAAVRYLAEHVEGNMLAAVQEINKLKLLYDREPITAEQMAAAISDSSRFTVFDLADAILAQDIKRLQHILQVLKEEDTALPLLVWAFGDLLRQLYEACENQRQQRSNQNLIMRLPKNRQAPFQAAVKRMERANWPALFKRLALLDQHSKGVGLDVSRSAERLWDGVFDMALAMMGKRLFTQ
ncbi:MAG: DNA polymerase III subunit delta [Thiolinea sp.]